MAILENDPRDVAYIALYIAIKWYKIISPEAALRLATGKSTAKPGLEVTPEIIEQAHEITTADGFYSFDALERKLKVSRYDIYKDESEVTMTQIKNLTKRLISFTEKCNGECDKCFFNKIMPLDMSRLDYTLCEMLCDLDVDNPKRQPNKGLHKSAIYCKLQGETRKRGFEIYETVLDDLEDYIEKNRDKKVRDIVNRALVEYMARH